LDRRRQKRTGNECLKPQDSKRPGMYALLQEGVNTGAISASGWIVGLGGLLITALWLLYLYR